MTTTNILFLGLVALCLIGTVLVYACIVISSRADNADEPHYRTADGGQLSADARTALQRANHTAADCSCSTVPSLRCEAIAAALGDLHKPPGTPPTPNPHAYGTLNHATWQRVYNAAFAGSQPRRSGVEGSQP